MTELTKSNEDYLEAIALLQAKHGIAKVRDIADMLNVKMPSVTAAMKQLTDLRLVEYKPYAPVALTPAGNKIAQQVITCHTILFNFLRDKLALSDERADEVACQIEHIMSLEEISRLKVCNCKCQESSSI